MSKHFVIARFMNEIKTFYGIKNKVCADLAELKQSLTRQENKPGVFLKPVDDVQQSYDLYITSPEGKEQHYRAMVEKLLTNNGILYKEAANNALFLIWIR